MATASDLDYLAQHEHIPASELEQIQRRGRILIAEDPAEREAVGWLRWGLFWDELPFINMLKVAEERRDGGIGRLLVSEWESRCREAGHATVMTSTLSSESAQHFYRRMGYRDSGCLLIADEALEIFFVKSIR